MTSDSRRGTLLERLRGPMAAYGATLAALIGLGLGGAIDWALLTYGLDFSVNGEGLSYGGVRLSARLHGVFELSAVLMSIAALYLMTALAAIGLRSRRRG